nr:GAF domain-containing sensor histidine kinase [Gramella sp. AN32]
MEDLDIFKSIPEESYDNITRLASFICETPIALISLVNSNEQWFKSKVGVDFTGGERELSFCGHAILEPENIMEVQDTTKDLRFIDNPFTHEDGHGIKFYAGVPLRNEKGVALGTLCVLDRKAHKLTNDQLYALKALGKQVESLFELRRKNIQLERATKNLNETNSVLREFASNVSHDLKMPLANMILTSDFLKIKYKDLMDEEGLERLNYLKQSGLKLSDYISGLLEHYSSSNSSIPTYEEFFLNDILEDIIDLLQIAEDCEISIPDHNLKIYANEVVIGQIFMNLINNSLKYNNQEKIIISIDCVENEEFFTFSVKDNGIGIPPDKLPFIFDLFAIVGDKDRKGKTGHGIGLSTVKKLVTGIGGEVHVDSEVGVGTQFTFTSKKANLLD